MLQNPRLQLLLFQDCSSAEGGSVRRKAPWFLRAGGRPKPLVPVPLPAFPPCDYSLPTVSRRLLQEVKAPAALFCSCRQLWLQLLHKAMTLQVSPSCPRSLSTPPSRGDTEAGSWCSCRSSQPAMATGWHLSEERRSTQEGLPSCAIGTTPSL